MVSAGLIPRVLVLLKAASPPALQGAALRLANNLAFDTRLRRQMVASGMAERLAEVLAQPAWAGGTPLSSSLQGVAAQLQPLALGLLYLASMEEPVRITIATGQVLCRCIGLRT
jgi:hypothetical protein